MDFPVNGLSLDCDFESARIREAGSGLWFVTARQGGIERNSVERFGSKEIALERFKGALKTGLGAHSLKGFLEA
jgi:hypothetical protein